MNSQPPERLRGQGQTGAALITVLLVVAIVSVIAVNLGSQLQNNVQRTASAYQAEQSYWMWLSAEEVLSEVLVKELDSNDGIAHHQQAWAQENGPFPVAGGGQIAAKVRDMYSCFNVNSLSLTDDNEQLKTLRKKQFAALLSALQIDDYQAQQLTDALTDFVDPDMRLSGLGAEDADYEALPLPYQTANSGLVDISELRLVRGFTAAIVATIKPYVCAIPQQTALAININTLDAEHGVILVGLSQGKLSLTAATDMLNGRPDDGYENVEQALSEGSLNSLRSEVEGGLSELTVNSEYFLLHAFLKWQQTEIQARSIVKLQDKQTSVIYRAMGE